MKLEELEAGDKVTLLCMREPVAQRSKDGYFGGIRKTGQVVLFLRWQGLNLAGVTFEREALGGFLDRPEGRVYYEEPAYRLVASVAEDYVEIT